MTHIALQPSTPGHSGPGGCPVRVPRPSSGFWVGAGDPPEVHGTRPRAAAVVRGGSDAAPGRALRPGQPERRARRPLRAVPVLLLDHVIAGGDRNFCNGAGGGGVVPTFHTASPPGTTGLRAQPPRLLGFQGSFLSRALSLTGALRRRQETTCSSAGRLSSCSCSPGVIEHVAAPHQTRTRPAGRPECTRWTGALSALYPTYLNGQLLRVAWRLSRRRLRNRQFHHSCAVRRISCAVRRISCARMASLSRGAPGQVCVDGCHRRPPHCLFVVV